MREGKYIFLMSDTFLNVMKNPVSGDVCKRACLYRARGLGSVLELCGSVYGIQRFRFILIFILMQRLVSFGH